MEDFREEIAKIVKDARGKDLEISLYRITDRILTLIKKEAPLSVPFNGVLCCRVREIGESMRSGDIVLINDKFRPLGFHTDFYHYFAGLAVVEGMEGRIITKAA